MKRHRNDLIITWNQKSSTYGMQHIEDRCVQHGIHNKFSINYKNIVDLDDSLTAKYGPGYATNPKLETLAKLNKLNLIGFVPGINEIKLFKLHLYKRIENSTNRKVSMMADILTLALKNSLITEPNSKGSTISRSESIRRVNEKKFSDTSSLRKELRSLQSKEKFKPGLYYIVWADLSESTKSSEKLTPEDNEKKVNKFLSFTKESLPTKPKNSRFFVKDSGDASLFLFNNFLDILKWKQTLDKKCKSYNDKILKSNRSKYYLIEYKTIVHLGEMHIDDKGDPKSLSLNQLSKIEKDFKKNHFGITEKVRLVILPRINSKQIKIKKIKEIKLQGEKITNMIWNITQFTI